LTSPAGLSAATFSLAALRTGGKLALAGALARLESDADSDAVLTLLSEAYLAPQGLVIGLTGPPGVGKSTLMDALIRCWRSEGHRIGCIAVDPSSRRSGGALLGDRTRLSTDPADDGVFVRSMAARDQLGGLAGLTIGAMVLMRALYDRVMIETVGVGQSETDITDIADLVLFCVQPGSGDSLQFMKAGIAEIPDLVAVTKADLGAAARRAQADAEGALGLAAAGGPPVRLVAAADAASVSALAAAIDAGLAAMASARPARRQQQAERWLQQAVRERFGRDGLARAGHLTLAEGTSPFVRMQQVTQGLRR
jgi:LAO/AO transport system kinase